MSPYMISPASFLSEPKTPPSSPAFRITLPTPPSFSAHRRTQSISSPLAAMTREVLPGPDSPVVDPNRGRSVSFSREVTVGTGSLTSPKLYTIPQRQSPVTQDAAVHSAVPSAILEETANPSPRRRAPPRPLALVPVNSSYPGSTSALSPYSRTIPRTAPTRFSLTAADKGLSIASALSRGARNSTSGLTGETRSIWSAGLPPTSASGWISPALGSARSTGTAARVRGLTVAVLKDGKDMVVGDLPLTPGLPSPRSRMSAKPVLAEIGSLANTALTPKKSTVILCRYYHTPGLTCTSSPCRFVHNLDTGLPASAVRRNLDQYSMQSPTQIPDPTKGTFAQAQLEGKTRLMSVKDVEDGKLEPGEMVTLESASGFKVTGTVFLMSGGGKGPAGKSKAKFKTVHCKDYEDGFCQYGEFCSFLHGEEAATAAPTEPAASTQVGSAQPDQAAKPGEAVDKLPKTTLDVKRRSSLAGPASVNAWIKPLPRSVLSSSLALGEQAIEKQRGHLSAFAAPYLPEPIIVDKRGDLIIKDEATAISPPTAEGPTAEDCIRPSARDGSVDVEVPADVPARAPIVIIAPPPKVSAWTKGPPGRVEPITFPMVEPVAVPTVEGAAPLQTPRKLNFLAPPLTGRSMFGTESDPATPWDPAIQHKREEDANQAAREYANPEYAAAVFEAAPFMMPEMGYPQPMYQEFMPTYYWGMPMKPSPGVSEGAAGFGSIPGGAGVMWTPAGWAVQDAAMKHALRTAEKQTYGKNVKARKPKNYYRTRPCKFYAEGICPHGSECTYLHELPASLESSSASSSSTPVDAKPLPVNYRTIPCKFFNSSAGCTNGASCAFLHTLVVPSEAPLVERPRPWRTRPCRHFLRGQCTLGEACHFAHVIDPTRSMGTQEGTPSSLSGNPVMAEERGEHHKGFEGDHLLTEERLARAVEGMKSKAVREVDSDDEDDDDVEIVTEDTSIAV